MMISGLDFLFLEVNSLVESCGFYQALGFELESVKPDHDPPMAALRAGRLKITIAQQLETMLRRGRGVHFFLTVDDVHQFYAAVRLTFPEIQPPADEGWGGQFVTLEDPDKYRFFFVTWNDRLQG
jgi:catechol 2,3-dioxygenase-like lactoylglutathione lyase family enzyme